MRVRRKSIAAIDRKKVDFVENEIINIKDDEALVRTIYSGVSSGTERRTILKEVPSYSKHWDKERRIFTSKGEKKKFPSKLGYSIVGEIEVIGKEVKGVRKGNYVWIDKPHANYSIVKSDKIVDSLLPKETDLKKMVFIPFVRIALGAVHDARIKTGDIVVVFGLGLIGNLTAQIARLQGARVVGVDLNEKQMKIARKLGIDVVNGRKDVARLIRDHYSERGADSSIETSGTYKGIFEAIRCCGITGKVVTAGSYPTKDNLVTLGEEWQKNKIEMISSMTVNSCPQANYPLWDLKRLNKVALDLIQEGKVEVLPLITHEYNFSNAKVAYNKLISDKNLISIVFKYK